MKLCGVGENMAFENIQQQGLNNSKLELFSKIASKAKTQDMSVIKSYFDQQNTVSSFYSSGHPLNLVGGSNITIVS